ncbi:Ig-specific serine endopeptidase MIP [Mycoplasmopsis arginini]|uniref:Ig-specific serine endopeptidase MIP n=1 Tax=Mycoplasmopsis arginini TaxID=2094 RepID=UPI00227C04ED|nr:hypothetical protein [Mycoplasmopsis arginini]MCY2902987.1 lipoprotein [Mycoplasmopsis arginini QMP CG1-2758]MDI3350405.1 hypothetical protein [Mycoplasmopsis arginini]MDI3351013.1 hypothetical protein [Mycoplasmopsis arginini]MDI3352694.1 hypothetical protein [Mycoplasmopsis arginini]
MNKQKKRILITSLLGGTITLLPTFGLISCENEISKEKRLIEESIDKLNKVINKIKIENKTSYKSKAFLESTKIINDYKENIESKETDLITLRKTKNNIKDLINELTIELNNYKKINEENSNNPKVDPKLDYPDARFENDFRELTNSQNIETNFDLDFNSFFPQHEKAHIYPSELQNQASSLKVKSKNEELNKKIEFIVNNIILESNANITGQAQINLVFRNKATNTQKNFIFKLDGLGHNPLNTDNQGNKPNGSGSENNANLSEFDKYEKLDQFGRFKKDNEEYLKALKQSLSFSKNVKSLSDLRPNLIIDETKKREFDAKAEELKLDSYDNSAYKGFSVPTYHKDGSYDGLEVYADEVGKGPSAIDSLGKKNIYQTIGLARTIVNEQFLKIAHQTFSLTLNNYNTFEKEITNAENSIKFWEDAKNETTFKNQINQKLEELRTNRVQIEKEWDEKIKNNKDVHLTDSLNEQKRKILEDYDKTIKHFETHTREKEIEILRKQITEYKERANTKRELLSESGTIWVLDYQPVSNGKYPTKWYFGTNAHVAKAITKNLSGFTITKINNDIKVGAKLRISSMDDNITSFSNQDPSAIQTVFTAADYLSKSPKEFLSDRQKEIYKDVEEFADFAVIEIDFEKMAQSFVAISNDKNVTQNFTSQNNFNLAKEITNNYANNPDVHIKFRNKSYLHDYQAINYPLRGKISKSLDNLYAVGWPGSRTDFYLKPYQDDDQKERAKWGTSYSLWTNTESEYYDAKITSGENGPSSFSEETLNRGDFLSYQIGYRSFADKPGILDSFLTSPLISGQLYEHEGKKYMSMALKYMPRRWAPTGGSSGSSVRNQNNELVAVHHATNNIARMGLSVAFRSEGFNYNGLFGNYNLPQYDLIYGGGEFQTKSYRQALKLLYPQLEKTNLFSEGLNDENIPDKFKFTRGGER